MEKYIVSARKYRPSTFSSVVGQNHITTTLKNAIKSKHLAQTFLFCGPRGVGKTTSARILAKTINCSQVGEDTEPCNRCESCVSFIEGRSMNILELDAASNNSVDDIRNLIEQVRFIPQIGFYKVYIIDEVHMLSNNAFNAFLKTLEEPPAHAIFILATTEKHKIIPTILSRCQIFDFNRIKIEDMANQIAEIAQKENISYEMEGLHVIAQKADGALRDALSMFDQIVTFVGNHVSYKAVIENLNILDSDYYFRLTDFLIKGNLSASLLLFNEVLSKGFEGNFFVNGLSQHLRNILVSRDTATLELLETSPGTKERFKNQANTASLAFLIKGLEICTKTEAAYKMSVNPRLLVELALMQLCTLQGLNLEAEKKKLEPSTSTVLEPKLQSETTKENKTTYQNTAEELTVTQSNTVVAEAEEKPIKNIERETTETSQKVVLSPNSFISSKPSIRSILNPPKKDSKDNHTDTSASTPLCNTYTDEELQKSWLLFAKGMQNKGKASLWHTLTAEQPKQLDGKIYFSLNNTVQENEVQAVITNLTQHLKTELQNDFIQIILEVIKDESKRKPYTNREKYNKLVEINPNLEVFKNMLNLEI